MQDSSETKDLIGQMHSAASSSVETGSKLPGAESKGMRLAHARPPGVPRRCRATLKCEKDFLKSSLSIDHRSGSPVAAAVAVDREIVAMLAL